MNRQHCVERRTTKNEGNKPKNPWHGDPKLVLPKILLALGFVSLVATFIAAGTYTINSPAPSVPDGVLLRLHLVLRLVIVVRLRFLFPTLGLRLHLLLLSLLPIFLSLGPALVVLTCLLLISLLYSYYPHCSLLGYLLLLLGSTLYKKKKEVA